MSLIDKQGIPNLVSYLKNNRTSTIGGVFIMARKITIEIVKRELGAINPNIEVLRV